MKITVNKSKKIGLPKFSSVYVSVSIEKEISDTSKKGQSEAFNKLWDEVQEQLNHQLKPYATVNPEAVDAGAEDVDEDWIKKGKNNE